MGLLNKIIAGGPSVKTRLHSQDGDMIDLAGLRYLPQCMVSTAARLMLGRRPAVPWLGYRAIRRLDALLKPDWKMIEYGSGMSTVWFAKRVGHVWSVEDHAQWYKKVRANLDRVAIDNITYLFAEGEEYYQADFAEDASIDFIMVDGSVRHECMQTAIKKIKPGGWIYLDNCDQGARDPQADRQLARKLLLNTVAQRGGGYEYFLDLLPTYLTVIKGLLAQIGKPSEKSKV